MSQKGFTTPEKRRFPTEEQNSNPSSPTAHSASQSVSPAKRQVSFDYWKTNPAHTSPGPSQEDTQAQVKNTGQKLLAIGDLVPGSYSDGLLKFRVSFTSQIRDTKCGKLFAFHGLDTSGEIAMISFGELADKYNIQLQVNRVYNLHTFNVKASSKDYPSETGHPYEVTLTKNSCITNEVLDADLDTFPPIPFNFVKLDQVNRHEVNEKIDVMGIVVKDFGLQTTASGRSKRDIAITDQSKEVLIVTLWAVLAETVNGDENAVMAFRRIVVQHFGGAVCLSCNFATLVLSDPQLAEAEELTKWFAENKMPEETADD